MSRSSTLILLGVLTILMPLSGFPSAFRSLASIILGACVLGIGLSFRTRGLPQDSSESLPPAEPQPLSPPHEISQI
jgi:hypothetical protein